MPSRRTEAGDLREACLREALAIIERSGVEALSLREVSRRLGVSHQAPYKHFPSRDHILAEIVRRAYAAFTEFLENRPRTGEPNGDLEEMGKAYFTYAATHPLQYRLMFGTPLPDPQKHPEMMAQAQDAFGLLRQGIARLPREEESSPDRIDFDALFVWSVIHGLASILQSHAIETLELPQEVLEGAAPEVLQRIGSALGKIEPTDGPEIEMNGPEKDEGPAGPGDSRR